MGEHWGRTQGQAQLRTYILLLLLPGSCCYLGSFQPKTKGRWHRIWLPQLSQGGRASKLVRTKSHRSYSFSSKKGVCIFPLGRKHSDLGNVLCSSIPLFGGEALSLQNEASWRNKTLTSFDPGQLEACLELEGECLQVTEVLRSFTTSEPWMRIRHRAECWYVIKTLKGNLTVCSLPNYWTLSLNVFI